MTFKFVCIFFAGLLLQQAHTNGSDLYTLKILEKLESISGRMRNMEEKLSGLVDTVGKVESIYECGWPQLTGGHFEGNSSYYRGVLRAFCDGSYTLQGNSLVECQADGIWSEMPKCIAGCKPPQAPNIVGFNKTIYPYDSMVSVRCQFGYRRTGIRNTRCLGDDKWSGDILCEAVDCRRPHVADYGTYGPSYSTTFKSTISMKCNEGFQLTGSDVIRCTGNGRWDGKQRCLEQTMDEEKKEISDKPRRPFKVCNKDRTQKVGVVASNYDELKRKCQEKLHIESDVSFVIESDGTEVDAEYLDLVNSDTLMVIQRDENWEGPVNCAAVASDQKSSDEKVMKLVQELRESKRRKCTGKQSKKGKDNRLISVQVGWLNYSYKDERYKLVKTTRDRPDSGPRLMKLSTNSTFDSIEKTLRAHYFPGKKSPIGHEKRYKFSVGTYNGEEFNKSLTLGEHSATHPKPRVYLLTKQTVESVLVATSESSSDSDFELPNITFQTKKQRTSATCTATEAMDFTEDMVTPDQLNLSTTQSHQILQDMVTPDQLNLSTTQSHQVLQDMDTPDQFSASTILSPAHQNIGTPTDIATPSTITSTSATTSESETSPVYLDLGTPTVELRVSSQIGECTVCRDRYKDTVIWPCLHPLCFPCGLHLQLNHSLCPICRGPIRKLCPVNDN